MLLIYISMYCRDFRSSAAGPALTYSGLGEPMLILCRAVMSVMSVITMLRWNMQVGLLQPPRLPRPPVQQHQALMAALPLLQAQVAAPPPPPAATLAGSGGCSSPYAAGICMHGMLLVIPCRAPNRRRSSRQQSHNCWAHMRSREQSVYLVVWQEVALDAIFVYDNRPDAACHTQ